MFTPTLTPTPNMKNFKQMVVSAFGPTFQESTRESYGGLDKNTKKSLDILIRDPEVTMKLLETFLIKYFITVWIVLLLHDWSI